MKIERRYEIEACADEEGGIGRAPIQYVNITEWRGNPVAVAANGYCLAVVPIELDDDDQPGLVHRSVFDALRSDTFGHDEITLRLAADSVGFEDGWTAPRRKLGHANDLVFPDWAGIVRTWQERNGDSPGPPAFQPRLLSQAQRALGSTFVVIYPGETTESPMLIVPERFDGELEPPFAIMMPAKIAKGRESDPSRPVRLTTVSA